MRFSSSRKVAKDPLGASIRRRVWMLTAMLAGVGWLAAQVREPRNVDKLGYLLGLSEGQRYGPLDAGAPGVPLALADNASEQMSPARSVRPAPDDPWSQVKDNAYFLPQEREAWFALLHQAQQAAARDRDDPGGKRPESRGEIAYAQLVQQPDVYRGDWIMLRGVVVRTERARPAENDLGIDGYDRLWVAPDGGGQWPFVVYVLELPPGFPEGDRVRATVSVEGLFFKNWSYSYGEGLGLAPVLVAPSVSWIAARSSAGASVAGGQARARRDFSWGWRVLAAVMVAAGVSWWAARQTARRRAPRGASSVGGTDAEVRHDLEMLSSEALSSEAVGQPADAAVQRSAHPELPPTGSDKEPRP